MNLPHFTGRRADFERWFDPAARSPSDLDRGIDIGLWRASCRPCLVDDLDANPVPRHGIENAVAVRWIAVADPDSRIVRGEGPNRLAHMERHGLGTRGDSRIDHIAVSEDRDAGFATRVHTDQQLGPVRFSFEDLDRLRDGGIDVVDGDGVSVPHPSGFHGRGQDRTDRVGNPPGEREAHEREVACLERRDEIVVETEILREEAEDLAHPAGEPKAS